MNTNFGSPPLVLLAADDLSMLQVMHSAFVQDGYRVAKAHTGAETLKIAEQFCPQLIMLNETLPDADGFDICARIQALPGATRTPVVLIVRSNADLQVAERALAAGAVDCISKPGDSAQADWLLLMRRIQYLVRATQAEEALLQERNQWRTLVDNLPDDIYIKDTQSRFVNVNIAVARALGAKTPGEPLGKTDFDFHPRDLAERYFADEQALLATNQPLINHEEPVFDHATGHMVWYLTTKVPITDHQGRVIGLVGVGRNITELKRVQDELFQERTLLRTLIDNVPDYIYVKDLHSKFLVNNIAHARLMGATPAELIGKTDYDMFAPELAARYYADEQAILQSGEALLNQEEPTKDRLGNPRWVLATKLPLRDLSGNIIGLAGVSRDITERKAVEEALLRSNAELEQFAYVASHDLQEPLRMVTSYVELLAERYRDQLDAQADQYIRFALDGAERMHQLIDDLLTYSRASVADKPLTPVRCELAYLVAVMNLQTTIKETGAEITNDPLPTVMADESRLIALFQNLIGNALKFHRDVQPRVHVSIRRDMDQWVFGVKDNGIGIPPEHFDKIFEVFKRLHTRDKYPGTGIGLAVCKKIVESYGGKIWVESQPGEGTTFYFTLPVMEGF